MDARIKALKAHRSRQRKRGLKRVEVTVKSRDVALIRDLAEILRGESQRATRLRSALRKVDAPGSPSTLAEILHDPSISGPEFDAFFEEIDRLRHEPTMMQIRDLEL